MVTYWYGGNSFDLKSFEVDVTSDYPHAGFTFTMKDPIRVIRVHNGSTSMDVALGTIESITIAPALDFHGNLYHGEMNRPPTDE
jgi:hypothetical protein